MTRKQQLEAIIQKNRELVEKFPGYGAEELNGPFILDMKDKVVNFFLKWIPDNNEGFEVGYDHSFLFFKALIEHPCKVNLTLILNFV